MRLRAGGKKAPRYSPAGQSTQIIVGADSSNDASILDSASSLYQSYGLKRVYYSAFSPIAHASARLPNAAPPLMREHRLYQADWLLRFYEFSTRELLPSLAAGNLDLALDPKTVWALGNRELFPVDVNKADRHLLLRVPGLGVRIVDRIIASRRHRKLRFKDIEAMGGGLRRARHFITTSDHKPVDAARNSERLRAEIQGGAAQGSLF